MLAKEIKIKTLRRQQNFIEEQIKKAVFSKDAEPSYAYMGYVYPEVIKHFKEEGFDVQIITSKEALALTKGRALNVFTVRDDITLSAEEQKQAEEYQQSIDNTDDEPDPDFVNLFKMISGFPM